MNSKTKMTLASIVVNQEEKVGKDCAAIGTLMAMVFELPLPMQQPRITAVKFQDLGTSFRVILTGVDGRKPVIAFLAAGTMVSLANAMFNHLNKDTLKWKVDEWALARLDENSG